MQDLDFFRVFDVMNFNESGSSGSCLNPAPQAHRQGLELFKAKPKPKGSPP